MSTKTYTSVKLPIQMAKNIDKCLVWMGFSSRAEYVREAIRSRLRRDLLYVEEKEEQEKRESEWHGPAGDI